MRSRIGIEWAAAAAAACILIVLLMVKPVIGMADNGDFQRIMGTVGLEYKDAGLAFGDKFFGYFLREFHLGKVGLGGYVTSSLVPVFAAKGLSRLLLPGGLFDMRLLAAVYILLFAAGAWLVVRYYKPRHAIGKFVLAGLLVVMFTDVGYSAYFNSLYSEPVSLVFMLLALGFAAMLQQSEEPSVWALTGFFVSALFLVTAKVQNAPVGILLALLCLRFTRLREEGLWRRRVRWYAAGLLAASAAIYFSLPKEIKAINEYQTVFYGVLKDSPIPAQDLQEMGLPDKLAVNAGTNYFEPAPIDQEDPVFAREYHPRFSHLKVALFYLKHPLRFYGKLETAAANGMTIRPYYLGNYEKAEGKSSGAHTFTFSFWSEFKRGVLPNRLWFIALIYAGYFGVLLYRYRNTSAWRERVLLEVFALVGLVGLLQFVTPVIGDGEADLAKHLFGFNVSFDLMLLASAVWLTVQLARAARIIKIRR